jgi:putative transcriptional regulator
MARFKLDANALPALNEAEAKRLDAMSDAEITSAALSDADNPPLSDDELARAAMARKVRDVRAHSGLSQARFAQEYRINVARLRDLEQGRTKADSAMLAYLTVIEKAPEVVRRALAGAKR